MRGHPAPWPLIPSAARGEPVLVRSEEVAGQDRAFVILDEDLAHTKTQKAPKVAVQSPKHAEHPARTAKEGRGSREQGARCASSRRGLPTSQLLRTAGALQPQGTCVCPEGLRLCGTPGGFSTPTCPQRC